MVICLRSQSHLYCSSYNMILTVIDHYVTDARCIECDCQLLYGLWMHLWNTQGLSLWGITWRNVLLSCVDGCSPGSPVQPVTVALRHFSLGVDPTAAYWDFDLLNGHGGWRAEGCQITGSAHNTTTIHCAHHNNLAVLMVRVSWSSKSLEYCYCGGAEPMKRIQTEV